MRMLTDLTRAWLTKSWKPFTFRAEYDEVLDVSDCESLGLYVHIPFCKQICSFCPYCKELYDAQACERYIDTLLQEIHLVGRTLPARKTVTSLYFGGGTPALAANRIGEVVAALRQYFVITEGVGLELHPDNVTVETLTALQTAGVTKISIGIQSFGDKYRAILGRKGFDPAAMRAALAAVPFETVSMDFIFALPGQTLADLQSDLETAFAIGANHVAVYPFIDFTFTKSTVPPMGKTEKRALLDALTAYCEAQGYRRDSIWTFSNAPAARYSSMTRDNFLGFGCSATTLLRRQFKINTFSVAEYQARIAAGTLPTSLTLRFTRRQRMVYYLFWSAYSTRVDGRDLEAFFGEPLGKLFGLELWLAKRLGFVTEADGVYEMTPKGAFYYHYYENDYTLAYIDKMWGILRRESFPEGIRL